MGIYYSYLTKYLCPEIINQYLMIAQTCFRFDGANDILWLVILFWIAFPLHWTRIANANFVLTNLCLKVNQTFSLKRRFAFRNLSNNKVSLFDSYKASFATIDTIWNTFIESLLSRVINFRLRYITCYKTYHDWFEWSFVNILTLLFLCMSALETLLVVNLRFHWNSLDAVQCINVSTTLREGHLRYISKIHLIKKTLQIAPLAYLMRKKPLKVEFFSSVISFGVNTTGRSFNGNK